VSGAVAFAVVLPGAMLASGCVTSWEQTTYATLAAGKALIDCAVAGYNHYDADIRHACAANPDDPAFAPSRFYIEPTRDSQQAIEKARQAQIACVDAFEAYAVAKVGRDKTVSLSDKATAVTVYLAQLPTLLNAVQALLGKAPVAAQQHGPDAVPRLEDVSLSRFAAAAMSLKVVPSILRSPDRQITRSPDSPEVSLGQ
jgi:hypothetical protein